MKITALELIDALDDILFKETEDLADTRFHYPWYTSQVTDQEARVDTIKEIREHLARLV